jgi:hypothetical protein
MALTLDIAGVDRTSVLGALSANIKRSLNQRSTATFVIDPRTSGYAPVVGNSVEVASGANKIFGGFIHSIKKRVEPGTSALKWNVRCLDYSHICDRRIVSESFPASSPGPLDLKTIVTGIASRFLSGEGITTTNVAGGFSITVDLPFRNRSVTECFDRLSTLSGWPWFIDPDKDLHFGPFETSPVSAAPFGLTATSENWRDLVVEQSLEQFRNVQIVQTGWPIEVTIADSWQMYPAAQNVFWYPTTAALTEAPTVKVNGVAKTVGSITNPIQPYPGTHDFYFLDPTDEVDLLFGVYVDDVNDWDENDTISIEYTSQIVHHVTRTDQASIDARAAIEGGSGRHEAVEDQRDLTTGSALNAYGDGLLRRHKNLPTVVTFGTDTFGLEPGQNINIVYALLGLNGDFLIEEVRYHWMIGGPASDPEFFRCKVKCSDQEVFGKPTKFFDRVVSMARVSNADNEVAAISAGALAPFKVTFLLLDDPLTVGVTQDHPYRIDDIDSDEEIGWETWAIEAETVPAGASLIVVIERSTDYSSWSNLATATLAAGARAASGGVASPPDVGNYQDYLRARVTQVGSSTAGGAIRVVMEGKRQRAA